MPAEQQYLQSGETAKLGGRALLPGNKFMNIYHSERDQEDGSNFHNVKVLTPTKQHASELVSSRLLRLHNDGYRAIVIHKSIWEKIRIAEDVELYNPKTGLFTSEETGLFTSEEKERTRTKATKKTTPKKEIKIKENMDTITTKEMLTQAALDGAKLVGANKANELIVDACSKALTKAGVPEELATDEMAQTLFKLVGPIVIHYLATTQEEAIDKLIGDSASERIREGCQYATQAATMDVMEPLLAFLLPLLKDLASNGFNSVMNKKEETGPALISDDKTKVAV
jgi:hypothetical protein